MPEKAFAHRGFMLDVSRHYMPVADIRKLLQAAQTLGLNRMHWHLTDDQGWRIEIRKYPKLTQIGSIRGDSWFGGGSETENNCGYYTQEEIRGIVEYAGSLGIDIIPEIEIPGHESAMLAAYPEYGCRRGNGDGRWPDKVEISCGIFPGLICAGKPDAMRFLKDILDEVTELFPYPAMHIGGDEAMKIRWRRCPDCRRRMREEGIETEDALQRSVVLEIGEYLASRGKRTIVWNDVLEGGPLPDTFIVQQWMGGEEKTRAFMENGGDVIRSDNRSFYLDYCYGQTNLKTIRETPRIPEYARGHEEHLLGVECPLWTERVTNIGRAAYQLFPRLTAVAVWMEAEGELSPAEFTDRVREKQKKIEALGLTGAPESVWEMSEEDAEKDRKAESGRAYSGRSGELIYANDQMVLLESTERMMREAGLPEDLIYRAGNTVAAEYYGEAADPADESAGKLIRQIMKAAEGREKEDWRKECEHLFRDIQQCAADTAVPDPGIPAVPDREGTR